MHPLVRTLFILLAIALVAGTAGATIIGTEDVPWDKDWALTALSPGPTADPTLTGLSYADARAYYVAGSTAWSNAWGASDIAQIRQYLTEARDGFIYCHKGIVAN